MPRHDRAHGVWWTTRSRGRTHGRRAMRNRTGALGRSLGTSRYAVKQSTRREPDATIGGTTRTDYGRG